MAADLCRRARRSKRGCAPVQRYSCGGAKYKEFAAAEAARLLGQSRVSPSRKRHIGITRDPLDEGSSSQATKQAATYGRLSELRRQNTETYPDLRLARVALRIEPIRTAPGWHHDAVEGSVLVAVTGDAPSSRNCRSVIYGVAEGNLRKRFQLP
jgi:hypothetical protein